MCSFMYKMAGDYVVRCEERIKRTKEEKNEIGTKHNCGDIVRLSGKKGKRVCCPLPN